MPLFSIEYYNWPTILKSENYVCRLKKQVDELKHAYILRINLKYLWAMNLRMNSRERKIFMHGILNSLLNDGLRIKFILAREDGTGKSLWVVNEIGARY